MKNTSTICAFFLFSVLTFGQEVKHSDYKVQFDVPHKQIRVDGNIQVDMKKHDSISFALWKNTKIESISIDEKNVDYSFDTFSRSPIIYIPDGGSLTIKNIKNVEEVIPIHFIYTCNMANLTGWAKSFSDEWIELGYYTAWYPVHNESKEFTSTISVSIDKPFIVSGSGMVKRIGGNWELIHDWPVFDNVIIAAKDIKTKEIREGNIALDLVYTTFPEKKIDSVSMKCYEIYEFFSSIFGATDNSYLKFVINPLKGTGGYGRSKFFSLKASEYNAYLIKGIAHEMSHFWWHHAKTITWEDWLNEAFAECSMLLYLRQIDKEEFRKNIEQYKKWTINSPPIWEIDRDAPEAYDAIYNKGSLILLEFEEKIGEQEFRQFLKALISRKLTNTSDFLNFVEIELSKEHRDWFENKLKT